MRNRGNIYLLHFQLRYPFNNVKADFRFWKCVLFLLFGLHISAIVCVYEHLCFYKDQKNAQERMWRYFLFFFLLLGGNFLHSDFQCFGTNKSLHSITEWTNILNENGEGRGYAVCRPVFCVPAWPDCVCFFFISKLWSVYGSSQIADTPAYMSWPLVLVYCIPTPKMRSGKKDNAHTERERPTHISNCHGVPRHSTL